MTGNDRGILIDDRDVSRRSEEIRLFRDIGFVSRDVAVLFGIDLAAQVSIVRRIGIRRRIRVRGGSGVRVCRNRFYLSRDGSHHGGEGPFLRGERLLASLERVLALRESLSLFGLMRGLQSLGYPANDHRVPFRRRLVFRAGAKGQRKRGRQGQERGGPDQWMKPDRRPVIRILGL